MRLTTLPSHKGSTDLSAGHRQDPSLLEQGVVQRNEKLFGYSSLFHLASVASNDVPSAYSFANGRVSDDVMTKCMHKHHLHDCYLIRSSKSFLLLTRKDIHAEPDQVFLQEGYSLLLFP